MAAKKAKHAKRSGGSMMRMRSGAQNLAGTGKKRKRKKGQAPITMQQTLFWGFAVAVVIVLIWRMTR